MPIPETLTPRLTSLLENMTRVDAASRPSVAEVQQELASIQQSLLSQGMTPAFIDPCVDFTNLPASMIWDDQPWLVSKATGTTEDTCTPVQAGANPVVSEDDRTEVARTTEDFGTAAVDRALSGHHSGKGVHLASVLKKYIMPCPCDCSFHA